MTIFWKVNLNVTMSNTKLGITLGLKSLSLFLYHYITYFQRKKLDILKHKKFICAK